VYHDVVFVRAYVMSDMGKLQVCHGGDVGLFLAVGGFCIWEYESMYRGNRMKWGSTQDSRRCFFFLVLNPHS